MLKTYKINKFLLDFYLKNDNISIVKMLLKKLIKLTHKDVARLIGKSPGYTRLILCRKKISMFDCDKVMEFINKYISKKNNKRWS